MDGGFCYVTFMVSVNLNLSVSITTRKSSHRGARAFWAPRSSPSRIRKAAAVLLHQGQDVIIDCDGRMRAQMREAHVHRHTLKSLVDG